MIFTLAVRLILSFFAGNRKLIWRQASLLGTCMYAYIYIMCIRLVNKNVRWPLQIKEDSQQNHVEPMNHAGFFADRAKVVWIPEYRNWMKLVTRDPTRYFRYFWAGSFQKVTMFLQILAPLPVMDEAGAASKSPASCVAWLSDPLGNSKPRKMCGWWVKQCR